MHLQIGNNIILVMAVQILIGSQEILTSPLRNCIFSPSWDKASSHKTSWRLEATEFDTLNYRIVLPVCLSNFRAIGQIYIQISRLRDFAKSYNKLFYRKLRQCSVPTSLYQWPISQTVRQIIIKIFEKHILPRHKKWCSHQATILHMPRQLSCRDMCKSVTRLFSSFLQDLIYEPINNLWNTFQ